MDEARPFKTAQVATAKNDDNKNLQRYSDWIDALTEVYAGDI